MIRISLPGLRLAWRRLRFIPLGILLVFLGIWNGNQIYNWIITMHTPFGPLDYELLSGVDPSNPYALWYFRWSIPAAWIWAGVVAPMGLLLWRVLHLAALLLLDKWRALLVFVCWPFWWDLALGNVLTFVMVAAYHALKGSRFGIVSYVALSVLVPRPLMIPVLAWLLIKYPLARWSLLGFGGAVLGITVALGQTGAWMANLANASGVEMTAAYNLLPSKVMGYWWLAIAWPLAAVAFMRGYLGIASVLIAPYSIGYYFLMLFLPRQPPLRAAGHLRDADERRHVVPRAARISEYLTARRIGVGAQRVDPSARGGSQPPETVDLGV